jgi:hypothetical protein
MLLLYRTNQSQCLSNSPPQSKRENIEVYDNAGAVYDSDLQCRFTFGDGAKACYQSDQDEVL